MFWWKLHHLLKFGTNCSKFWKMVPFIYQNLKRKRGHWFTSEVGFATHICSMSGDSGSLGSHFITEPYWNLQGIEIIYLRLHKEAVECVPGESLDILLSVPFNLESIFKLCVTVLTKGWAFNKYYSDLQHRLCVIIETDFNECKLQF